MPIEFDFEGARKSGATDKDISGYFKEKYSIDFDIEGAKKNGANDADILDYLNTKYSEPVKKKEPTIGLGYEKPSEALRMGGLPKQEKLSQSPLKTAETTTPSVSTKPKQNIDYLTDINNLYKEKVSASQGRVNLKKQLVDLKPQIDSAYADIEQFNALYNDVNLPLQERNEAAKQANILLEQVAPVRQQYDKVSADYNNLVAKDKDVLARLKQVDAERQKALDKDFSISKDFIEKTEKGFVDAAAGIAGIFNTLGLSGDPESPETREEVKEQTRQNIDKIREFGNKLVTQEAPKEFEKAFEGKMTPRKLLYLTSSAVAQAVPTVAAGLFTGGAGTALAGAGMGFNESKDIFKQAGLNDSQAEWAALGLSVPLGLLESYGVDDVVRVISNPLVKKKVAAELAKNLAGKQITKELLFNESRKSLGKVIAQNAGGIFTTGLKEGSTEILQGGLQEVAKQTTQEYTGVNPDDEMPFDEYVKGVAMDLAEQGAGGVLGGSTLQTGGQLISGGLRGFKADFTPSVYSQVKEFENPEKYAEFEQDLQEDIDNGLISVEQADEAMQNIKSIQEADAKIPSTIVDNDKRTKAVNLIIEKNNIEKEIENKDKSLVLPQTERLKEIDNELANISKGETTTDGEGTIEGTISAGTDVAEEGLGMATEPSKEGVAGEDIQAKEVLETPSQPISVSLNDKGVYIKDGELGVIRIDGQSVVFETNDKIIELGNKDELAETPISEFGIEKEEKLDISVNEDNSITIDGVRYVNNFSDPQAAINTDADGNVVSVNLETEDGKKRTIRGQRAEEIAYQYKLKEFEQNATEESIARLEQEVTRLEGEAQKPEPKTKKRSTTKRKQAEVKPQVTVSETTTTETEVTPTETKEVVSEKVTEKPEVEGKKEFEDLAKKNKLNFRTAQNIINKYVRPFTDADYVGVTQEDIDLATANRDAGKEREGYKEEKAKKATKTETKKTKPEQIGDGLLDILGIAPVEPTEGEVKFSKTTGEPQVLTPTEDKEQQVIDQMNKMNLVNEGIDLVTPSTTTEEIDVNELNSRLDNPLKTVKWSAFKGMPFTFTISDQLRTGDAVNPNTGQTITDLKGGIGFNGTKGNENNAWANTTKEEAESMLQRAKDVYANNKPLFDKLWKEGKLPNGHIPMAVVKMAETSILSNEAVFRVGIQNIETLPKANRKKAVLELAKSMQAKIDTESASLKRGVDKNGKPYTENTIKLKKKAINQYQKILDSINKNKYDDIVDVLKDKSNFSLPEKSLIANEVFYGSPTPIGGKEIDISRSRPSTPVSKALLGNANPALINLGKITDLLTEPSMKNVPNMHVVSIVGVDIKATDVNKINHPNYPYGVKGMSLGALKNPVHMKDAFGEAYGSALGQVVKNEAANASVSVKSALTQGIPVQSGLPNRVFKSAIAKGELDAVDKLAGFLRQAFPNTTFFTSNEAWDAAMANPSIKKKLKDGDVVYAFTTDGNVFINPTLKTTKATLHETGHIWMGFVKENNPALHAKGLELVTGTKEHQKAIKEYGDTELAREEALMELMSSKGDTIVNASQKAKFKEWLLSVYKYIADNFTSLLGLSPKQIENLTLDKFLEGMLADVLSGKEITTKKIKGEVKFSRESQNDRIKEFIESQRKSGQSDKDIRAGLELVADKVGLTKEDINDLMSKEVKKEKSRAFATKAVERAGVPIEDIPASLRNYRPTTVEEQQKIAEDFISKNGINNTITALRLPDSGIDPKSKPVLASVLLKELYAEQGNTKDVAEIEKIAIDVHNVLDSVLTSATEAAQFMAMMREFYNSNPYNYVAQVTRLIEKNINNPIKANVATAVVNINNANKAVAGQAANNVVKEEVTSKVTSAKEKFERSKANLKALWKKSFNIGIAANQYEAAKNDVEFAKALTIMAKDFVVYQSVQFSEFLKEVASQIGLQESDIDQDHLRKIFEKAKSERIQAGIKVGLKELELKLKDLIESHYSATELEGKLIDKLKSELGVGSAFGLNDAAIKELENAIKREIKVLTAKEKIKALKALGIKEQQDVNEILSLSEEGLLDDNAILETLGDKLGIKKLTPEEAAKLADLAKDINESKEDRIKARNIQKFEDYKFVLAKKYKIQDFLLSNYLTNIFGSLTSNEKNIAGNVSETILLVGELMGNALASGNPKDIQRALKALVEGNIRGFDFTKEVITTGVASYKEPGDIRARNMWELIMDRENDLTRTERNLQKLFSIPYLGPVFLAERRFWNRALLSMDSLSGTTNNELGSLLAATREADKQKLRGAKRTKFIQEQMANSAEAQEEARDYAISLGYKPGTGEFNRAVQNYLVSKRPEAIKKAAAEYSARATLTQRPPENTMTGAIANGLNNLIAKNPSIKFFVPVVNTFANLIVKNIERSPFEIFSLAFDAGRAASGVESAKAGLTKAEVARRMKTAAVWTGISVLLFALAGGTDDDEEGFEIFGSGTGDPVVDKARRALGWKPNTIRFSKEGGYYNFEFLPFGFVLGMIGNMRDYFKYKKEPAFRLKQAKAKEIFGKNLDALTEDERTALDAELAIPGKYNISEQERKEFANLSTQFFLTPVNYSFQLLKSLGELVNAVGEGDTAIDRFKKSITTIGRGIASPRYLGEVRDIFDNKLYDTKEFRNVLAANVPVVKLGNVLLDGFGREVEKYKSESMFSGIKYALTRGFYNPPTIKPLDQFLWENRIGIAPPENTPSMAYTQEFHRDYIVTRGKILMTNLTEALNNKEFAGLTPQEVLEVVNAYITNANAEARSIIDEKLDKLK